MSSLSTVIFILLVALLLFNLHLIVHLSYLIDCRRICAVALRESIVAAWDSKVRNIAIRLIDSERPTEDLNYDSSANR